MERGAIPITTATTVCCQPQIHIMFAWGLLKAAIPRSDLGLFPVTPAKLSQTTRKIACAFVCIYVLSFATIAAIMTGYRTAGDFVGVIDVNGKPVSLDNLRRARIVLDHGTQLGLPNDSYRFSGTVGSAKDEPYHNLFLGCQ